MKVKIKLTNGGKLPEWNNQSAGCDLFSLDTYTLKPGERKLFKTGVQMAIPVGLYGRIAPRSGLAFKDGIDVMAGVIDPDYRGEIGVILINLGQTDKTINFGDKIAQLIFENYTKCDFDLSENLDETSRGAKGYGSTDRTIISPPTQQQGFRLLGKTTVEKYLHGSEYATLIDRASAVLGNHDGDIYQYAEKNSRGLCVVDPSGTVLEKFHVYNCS